MYCNFADPLSLISPVLCFSDGKYVVSTLTNSILMTTIVNSYFLDRPFVWSFDSVIISSRSGTFSWYILKYKVEILIIFAFVFSKLTLAKHLLMPRKPSVGDAFKRTFSTVSDQNFIYETSWNAVVATVSYLKRLSVVRYAFLLCIHTKERSFIHLISFSLLIFVFLVSEPGHWMKRAFPGYWAHEKWESTRGKWGSGFEGPPPRKKKTLQIMMHPPF